ncbi:MAG: hypothetical protein U0T69_02930 [Chitinophagales bacterium]
MKKQQRQVGKHVARSRHRYHYYINSGKKEAPVLVTEDMVKSMKFGSVILDMAVKQVVMSLGASSTKM